MAANLGTLTLDLIAKIGGFTGPMDQAARHSQKRAKEIEKSMANAADAIKTVVGALAVGVSFTQIIRATADFQNEQAQLAAVLKSTGEAAGFSQGKLNEMAEALSRTSIISAGEINQAQTTLLAFTGIVGEEFPRALQAAVDMASRTGMSVVSASETIGRALDIPSKGLAALSKQGFRFSEDQKKLAEYLESTGRTAEAQAMILAALEESYGGAAQAARDTLGGALTALSNSFNDLLTGEDGVDQATDAINSLTDTLSDPRIKEAFGVIVAGVFGVTEAVARALPYVVDFTKWAAEELAVIAGGIGLHDLDRLEEKASKLQSLLTTMESRGETGYAIYSSAKADYEKVKAQLDQAYALAEMADNLGSGKGKEAPKLNQQALLKEAEAARESARAQEDAIKARAKASEAIDRQVAALQLQADTVAMSSEQATLYKLRVEGATEAQLANAEAALSAVSAYKEQAKAIKDLNDAQEQTNKEAVSIIDSLRTEEEAIRESYERRRQIIMDATLLTAEERNEALLRLEQEHNEQMIEVNGSYWERYLAAAEENLQSFDELSGVMLENFTGRFGDAFESMVFDSQSLGDAVSNLAEGMARSVVNALGQMAAQWLAYQAVQLLVGKTTQASAASTMTFNALASQQMAAINAFASTAAIPIVGPLMAPAASAAAIAATSPMVGAVASLSLAGMAHEGIDAIPETGTWLLEKGERVTTAETSAKLDKTLSDIQSGGAGAPVVNLYEDSAKAGQVNSRQEDGKNVIDIFVSNIMSDGKAQKAISRKFGIQGVGQ
ncbi:phage tail length tape measure family protein [Stutzerimonas frequens]|uniref:phage tail length tape measure family protein n=1 Tax=Stutzerimonas frequens TaxID=2968969 RepID=UPI001F3C7715|nr:phage tail length tape measure family protein [Stutzerimonas frequens]